MVTGKLEVMGRIEIVEDEVDTYIYPMALLITFDNKEDIRAAIKDGECKFTFGEDEPI